MNYALDFSQSETQKYYFGMNNKYLLLTGFSVRTVNYGLSFFPSIYGPSTKRAGHKLMEKTRFRNLQYRPKKRG